MDTVAKVGVPIAVGLGAVGSGSAGVAAGSLAASWQGLAVAAGSWFATCQSVGAAGLAVATKIGFFFRASLWPPCKIF